MGEEQFTPEELAVLGEEPDASTEEGTGTLEPDGEIEPEGEAELEGQSDDTPEYTVENGVIVWKDGEKIPVQRTGQIWFEKKEVERKLDLLRTNPEAYYEAYPEDRPQTPREAPQQGYQSMGELLIQGGPYEGWTLNQVYQEDPAEATRMQNEYIESIRSQKQQEQEANSRLMQEVEKDARELSNDISKEFYNGDYDSLNDVDKKKVDDKVFEVATWMQKTGRGGGIARDAYFLMNRENLLKSEREKGAKGTIDALSNRSTVPSINAGRGTGGNGSLESMSKEAFETLVGNMGASDFQTLMASKSPALRAKYPGLPWD